MALHFQCLPTDLDPEQVKDYLYELQQRSQTPSQTYFKHTVYGLRFLLKTEGLPYDHLHLPEIARPQKLPVILSRQEIWTMLTQASLLKHKLLFTAVWRTLSLFAQKGGLQMGMIAVLHTWGQNLCLHPHLHCIVPGGGIDGNGKWERCLRSNKYLFPVKALSKVFRAKYVRQLRDEGVEDKPLFDQLFAKQWVVYAKRPFGGPRQVIEYLGRYTHKVAISNHRIEDVNEKEVTFRYKDYKAGGGNKQMTLCNQEFVKRFSQHILPKRFVRIRHYGILSSHWKRGRLQALQKELKVYTADIPVKTLLRRCPCCKTGTLVTIEVFGQRGPPGNYLRVKQPVPVG